MTTERGSLGTFLIWTGWLCCQLLVMPLAAQLSPGDLATAHAHLEGLKNCVSCHEARRQVLPAKCLDCHQILKERIEQKLGLHARAEYQNCVDCHTDHHGRDFKLIFWKGGKEKFDHSQTGFNLQGAHITLDCQSCHQSKNISRPQPLVDRGKDLNATFLGLTPECLSCHQDEHRGQLAKDCLSCHQMQNWKPVSGFDHDRSRFRLIGNHVKVECWSCHSEVKDKSGGSFRKFSGLAFANCSSCHNDAHQGSFGADCQSCHNPRGWKRLNTGAEFDHSRTNFPLRGAHGALQCQSCHKPDQPRAGLAFANCIDCHSDPHEQQFANLHQAVDCSECHSENGFTPSLFTIEKHQASDFPLDGGHLAIPCIACHQNEAYGILPAFSTRSTIPFNRFSFDALRCADCHVNPHDQVIAPLVDKADCLACHSKENWRKVNFDHQQTGFALEAAHSRVDCLACHKPTASSLGQPGIAFAKAQSDCASCHQDVHREQFARQGVTDCSRCHQPVDWQPRNFDHDKMSRFVLEGAHQSVDCAKCHREVIEDGARFVTFKPLDTACAACHGG